MNYDFKANWNDIILPLLSLSNVKKSIKKGINSYITDGNCSKYIMYDCNKCPASYGRGDGWVMYMDDYEESLTTKLFATGFLKQNENIPSDDDEFENYFDEEYSNYKNNIIKPFITHHEKNSLRAYQMFGACHWWNPTFCLTLAKIIYPNKNWKIKKGFYHTTIVNSDESLVFDILYFDENDSTKGGSLAIYDSSKKEINS
jgi:hypothetical protein